MYMNMHYACYCLLYPIPDELLIFNIHVHMYAIVYCIIDNTHTVGYVFENLPGGIFNDIVRLFLSLELTLTFPIVFKPASEVMEEILQNVMLVSEGCGYTIGRYASIDAV